MKRTDLTDFGIPELNKGVEKNNRRFNKGLQTEMMDFSPRPHQCSVSGEMFKTKLQHKLHCRYRYCKSGWVFRDVVK